MNRIRIILALALMFTSTAGAWADYAAIAYSPNTGRWAYSHGQDYLDEAMSDALARCGEADGRVVVWVEDGWAALAVGDNGAYGWGWSNFSLAEAMARALDNAGNNARIRCWVYSGE